MTDVDGAKALCREYGFATIVDSSAAPGFVATHPKGWKVAFAGDGFGGYIIYGKSRRNGASEGHGIIELRHALQRNRVLFDGIIDNVIKR